MNKFHDNIDKVIASSENYSLSDSDLLNLTDNKVKVLSYSDLENYDTIDQVLEPFGAVIILYQKTKTSGHWSSIIKQNNNIIEIFDSLGVALDHELEFSDYNKQRHSGIAVPHLTNLLNKSRYEVEVNMSQIQKDNAHINTCGRWAGLRVRFRDIPMKKFIDMFKNGKNDPDYMVTALTILFS
jgi:hypothetical protein